MNDSHNKLKFIENSLSTKPGAGWRLLSFCTREDNTGALLCAPDGAALAVDVPEAAPLLQCLQEQGLRLTEIWITHGHRDHVAGVSAVVAATGCAVRAHPAAGVSGAIPLLPGATLDFHGTSFEVIDTSAHSSQDFSFSAPGLGVCFCGDTLFPGGCGRIFAGTHEQMWRALLRLRSLPDSTLMVCGHDYALENLTFAVQTFPEIAVFRDRLTAVRRASKDGQFQGVTPMETETRSNPMLMADHPEIAAGLGMRGKPPVEVFARIRELRNEF